MKFSYQWLIELIPTLSENPSEIAELLSRSLAEVEGVEHVEDEDILEIENKALSHRADLFGHVGLAREVAAVVEKHMTVTMPKTVATADAVSIHAPITIQIENPSDTPRYAAVVIDNVIVGPSPDWLQQRLKALGMRPINNIVDVTNYLMVKYSQPLHAFDFDLLKGKGGDTTIQIRKAKAEEHLVLLDGRILTLSPDDLVIAVETDGTSKPVALAGIMGGQNSQITETTKQVIIEAAVFNMYTVRGVSRRHGIRSEASLRFEKGLDPQQLDEVLTEAVYLLTGGTDGYLIDNYPTPSTSQTTIAMSAEDINHYFNINETASRHATRLAYLGFETAINGDNIVVTVPSFRKDVLTRENILEEIGRLTDYNKIEPTLPSRSINPPPVNEFWEFKFLVRDILSRCGLQETMSYSFVPENQAGVTHAVEDNTIVLQHSEDINGVKIKNPIDPAFAYLRSSLLPSIINNVIENAKRFEKFGLYEIMLTTLPKHNQLPDEPVLLSFVVYDRTAKQPHVLQHTKQIWQTLLSELRITSEELSQLQPMSLNLSGQKGFAFAYEVDVHRLAQNSTPAFMEPIPLSPATIHDTSFYVDETTPVGEIVQELQAHVNAQKGSESPLAWLHKILVHDMFQNETLIKEKKKSITLRLIFQHPSISLSDTVITPVRQELENLLVSRFNVTIR